MQYDVRLTLSTEYDGWAGGGRHQVRVVPKTIEGIQRVVMSSLSFDPRPAERVDFIDFFETAVSSIAYRHAHQTLDVKMAARVVVERVEAVGESASSVDALQSDLAATLSLLPNSPHHFLASTPHAGIDPDITAYAARSLSAGSMRAVAADLCARIHRDFRYDGNATTVRTRAREAFDLKRGVCQDFSHVMIAGLRGLGIPAGYVSGFLRTLPPPGKERLEGADAMHAWVKVWTGATLGWLEFDPTNTMPAGNDHIVVGSGRDYGDVSPIVGVLRTSGGQEGDQAVDVIPIE